MSYRITPPVKHTLYLIEAPSVGLVKIGKAEDTVKRFIQIAHGSPVEVRRIGERREVPVGLEAELLKRFAKLKVKGDWFTDSPAIRAEFGPLEAIPSDSDREIRILIEYKPLGRKKKYERFIVFKENEDMKGQFEEVGSFKGKNSEREARECAQDIENTHNWS